MTERRRLKIKFHGRVIDHLAIQMYQSPTAAVAEMVANAWDADATRVEITLPDELGPHAEIVVSDNGSGMTLEEVQEQYLNVGYNRRGDDPASRSPRGRPLMGRKGIGKFAGFGIAEVMNVVTTSGATGESTSFKLDLNRLRGDGDYVDEEPTDIPNVEYSPPDDARRDSHGTTITLRALGMRRRPSQAQFLKSMSRRFLLLGRAGEFEVVVDGVTLPSGQDELDAEIVFPRDYRDGDRPEGLNIDEDGWGRETLSDGNEIRWRVVFTKEPIRDEDLRGISVFAHGKLAQTPFYFNVSGGISAQHGQEYLSGSIDASYLDDLPEDLISTERQRIDWNNPTASVLQDWGQARLRDLLLRWNARRTENRTATVKDKVAPFSSRLERLPSTEARVMRRMIEGFAKLAPLSEDQFVALSESVLTAWERGRLRELIEDLDSTGALSTVMLLETLEEEKVLTALQAAEAAKSKLATVRGLRTRLREHGLDEPVKAYLAANPWLLSLSWEALEATPSAGRDHEVVLDSPSGGVTLRWLGAGAVADARAVEELSNAHRADSKKRLLLLWADRVGGDAHEAASRSDREVGVSSWDELLERAEQEWRELLATAIRRAPDDERLRTLVDDS